jgi:ABC-type branched-subunit amino acid transport system substrate-binding protein
VFKNGVELAVKEINDNGGIFLHGANLGLERRW